MSKKEKLNIADILQDCPSGIELYSIISGEMIFKEVLIADDKKYIKCCYKGFSEEAPYVTFRSDGSVMENGECVLFPSKKNRDWKKFEKPIVVDEYVPAKTFWYKITDNKQKNAALLGKLKDLMPDTMYCYQPTEDKFAEGRIVYNNYSSIEVINDVDRTFSQILKMTCIELRIKGE